MKPTKKQNPWTTLSQKEVYNNPWISISHREVINPSGGNGIYGVVQFKNVAVGILPLDEQYNTWLVGQYRYPLQQYSWEIPEGGAPLGSDTLIAAKRELKEEVGLVAQDWQVLLDMHVSNSVTDEYGIAYIAQNIQQGMAEPEETEDLQIKKLPFEEAWTMAMEGLITDSLSLATIFKTKFWLDMGRL